MQANTVLHQLRFVDGLRAILALMVVNEHLVKAFLPVLPLHEVHPGQADMLTQWMLFSPIALLPLNGALAVSMFFILSGVVLAHSLSKSTNMISPDALWFLVRRYIRFAIPVTVMLCFLILLNYMGSFTFHTYLDSYGGGYRMLFDEDALLSLTELLAQGSFSALFLFDARHNPVLWTISVEMWGAVMVGFLMLFKINPLPRKFRLAAYYSVLMVLLWYMKTNVLSTFLVGVFAYEVMSNIHRITHQRFVKWISFVIGVVLLCYHPKGGGDNMFSLFVFNENAEIYGYLVYGWASGFLFIAMALSQRCQKALQHRLLRQVGRCSFSIYLLHYLVIGSVGMGTFMMLSGTWYQYVLTVLAVLTVSLTSGVLFHQLVERPSVRLGRVFATGMRLRVVHPARKTVSA